MMPALSISPRVEEARYLALLHAANAIATCRDCHSVSETLLTQLHEDRYDPVVAPTRARRPANARPRASLSGCRPSKRSDLLRARVDAFTNARKIT